MILCMPFMMFQGRAQEAIDHYLATFPDAQLLEIMHHPEGTEIFDPEATEAGPGTAAPAAGTSQDDTAAMETVVDWDTTLVATAQLQVGGQILMIQDSLVKHAFDFTPSMSMAVVVDTEEEFHRITNSLVDQGEYLMEPGDYDFAQNFAWVQDRFGMTWQINHPRGTPNPSDTDSAANVAQSKAPEWS
ncbi:VOC family protein [Nesterenkonia sphaerica]|nr:VOC family protein [Nesterenkonia sphaerica]